MFTSPSAYDYPNGLQAALSTAWQAGFTEAKPALDMLATALVNGIMAGYGGKEWKYSLRREPNPRATRASNRHRWVEALRKRVERLREARMVMEHSEE